MTAEKDPLSIVVCGVGGQGNVLLSRLMVRALSRKGYIATIGETYGASQRGGSVESHVRVSRKRAYGLIPEGKADVILSLEPMETVRMLGRFGSPEVAVVSNICPVNPLSCVTGEKEYPDLEEMKRVIQEMSASSWLLDATQIAIDMGNPLLQNIVMLGALLQSELVPLTRDDAINILQETFRKPAIFKSNIEAIDRGMQACISVKA